MDINCIDPKCHYSDNRKKCVKPNSYIETIAWCKRNKLNHTECKDKYALNKKDAMSNSCNRYRERLQFNIDKLNKVKRVKKVKELKEKIIKPKKQEVVLSPVDIKPQSNVLSPVNIKPQSVVLSPVNIKPQSNVLSSIDIKPQSGLSNINSNINRVNTKSEPNLYANSKCVSPKCVYSDYRKKCVKPNPFIESNSRCVKSNSKKECVNSYNNNKLSASNNACSNYEERLKSKSATPVVKSNTPVVKSNTPVVKSNTPVVKSATPVVKSNTPIKRASSVNILNRSIKKKRNIVVKPKNPQQYNNKTIDNDVNNIFNNLNKSNKEPLLKVNNKKILKIKKKIEVKKKSNSQKISPERLKKIESFIKRRAIKSAAKKIQRLMMPFANRTSVNIYDRIRYTELVRKYLADLDSSQCIIPILDKNKSIKQYRIANKILLPKQIGTVSKYGIIYKSKGENKGELFRFATKLMKLNTANRDEIEITNKLSNIVLKNKNPHFPITYRNFTCLKPVNSVKYPTLTKKSDYYIFLNELANGDLNMFLHSTLNHDNAIIKNAITQLIIAVQSFHKHTGMIHDDCHWGNFLYHKVKKGGYIHYNINNTDLYLENIGYLWIIWDYGLMSPVRSSMDFYKDFYRIIHMVINVKNNGILENIHVIPNDAIQFIDNLLKEMRNNAYNEKAFVKNIFNNKLLDLLDKSLLPINAKIINSSPYIL